MLALESVYLGKIARDDRNAFLAYWVALELLLESAEAAGAGAEDEGAAKTSTVIKQAIPSKSDRNHLQAEVDAALARFISDAAQRQRALDHALSAKAESDVDRWTRLLRFAGIATTEEEVKQLRKARGSVVHGGAGGLPTTRLREIVTLYLKKVLGLTR